MATEHDPAARSGAAPISTTAFADLESHLYHRLGHVPVFEKNAATLAALRQAVDEDRRLLSDLATERQLYASVQHDLEEQVTHLSSVLAAQQVSPSSLSKQGAQALDALVDLAMLLDLGSVATSSYKTALTDIDLTDFAALRDAIHDTAFLDQIHAEHTALSTVHDQWSSFVAASAHDVDEKRGLEREQAASIQTLCVKRDEYLHRANALASPPRDVRYPYVAELAREVRLLETKLDELKAQLNVFQGIPPDRVLVQLQLEEAKRELMTLKARREELLMDIAKFLA
ncbi:hypothetical protein AMAG_13334 [Allomyces macrogynus ATCC 38327]|uniref:HAUS augmin-like complex subunit 1 n=1 Tax=Allomyces macrogynus (strain ATCC 38327) TaxID=578462 RepID=A0A0L0T095_ALLM3|nr:hypothetical protein AMAG_13334 [Allomyces macrogynus ATCC 38327]|eukprot:KNE68172.1 hypothetical protein AMAG_13334 [Allomyces macrogynus ATCC 38327]